MLNLVAFLACLSVCAALFATRRSPVRHIPGPPSPSLIFGNLYQLLLTGKYGDYEYKWQKTYGPFYRIKGCLLEDRLMISDPAAVKHIINTPEVFKRSFQQQETVNLVAGHKSVLNAEDDDHRRYRSIMNPAFTPGRIRELSSTFEVLADKLVSNWESLLATKDRGDIMDLVPGLTHASLDAVGNGAFGYDFGALDGSDNELAQLHENVLAMAAVRSKTDLLFESVIPWFPQFMLDLAKYAPTHTMRTLLRYVTVGSQVSQNLVKNREENFALIVESGKDLLNVMVLANQSAKESQRMSNVEIEHQIPTILIAGQDTTGNTFALALLELSRNLKLQSELRAELANTYDEHNGHLDISEIEQLPLFNAFIKEFLRFYPALPMTERVTAQESIIPLSTPLVKTTGETVTEVYVPRGQHIVIAMASFNRLESVWGEDAGVFRPSRWLDGQSEPTKGSTFGPYAGLASFLGGPHVCIGWRFAIAELQVVLSALIRKFEFELPDDSDLQEAYALSMTTMSKSTGNISLPLHVKKVDG